MDHPDKCPYDGYCSKHLCFIVFNIADQNFQGATKKVSACPHDYGPDQCTHDIKKNEVCRRNRAHADYERDHHSKPIEEAKYKDQGGSVLLYKSLGLIHTLFPGRVFHQDFLTVPAT